MTVRAAPIDITWQLRRGTRKTALGVHVVTAGAWVGIDVILGVLVFTASSSGESATVAAAYQALPLLFWPMLAMAVACLLSGVLLSVSSRWGLLRHRWVVTKLVINLVLVLLVMVLLGPGVDEAADAGRRLAAGGSLGVDLSGLVYPPIVSTSALLVATFLAVAKPWGRVRRPA